MDQIAVLEKLYRGNLLEGKPALSLNGCKMLPRKLFFILLISSYYIIIAVVKGKIPFLNLMRGPSGVRKTPRRVYIFMMNRIYN